MVVPVVVVPVVVVPVVVVPVVVVPVVVVPVVVVPVVVVPVVVVPVVVVPVVVVPVVVVPVVRRSPRRRRAGRRRAGRRRREVVVVSVQFNELVLLDEIAVSLSALTAKTPRIPPAETVNGLVMLIAQDTTLPLALLAAVSVTVVSFFDTFPTGSAFEPLFGAR